MTPRPDPDVEPLTLAQKIVGLLLLAVLVALLTLLILTGHPVAAFIIALALGVAGTAVYLGTER